MQIQNRRQRQIIYHLVANTKPMTSMDIAEKLSVSQRTIKADMLVIRDLLKPLGATLEAKKGLGYSIEVNNGEIFYPFYEQLIYNRMLVGTFLTDKIARFVYIARTLVASDKPIKVEEISDEMFLSRSAIKQEMKAIYSFFNSYHLEIESIVGKGIRVVGEESNLRLAIVELVVNHYHKIQIQDTSPQYARILECSEELRQKIRRSFLATLRESKITCVDDETLFFAFYLVVVRNRIGEGHHISLTSDVIQDLKKLEENSLARHIFNNLQEIGGFEVTEDEIAFAGMLLHGMRDFTSEEVNNETINFAEAFELSNEILEYIDLEWSINLRSEHLVKLLTARFIPFLTLIKYGLSTNQRIIPDMSAHEIGSSPLAIELSRSTIRYIETKYFCRLNSRHVTSIAFVFYGALSQIKYKVNKLRLLTVSTGGKEAGRELTQRLNTRFGEMIESNEAVELYEIRGLDQSKYDFVIMNEPEFTYFYDIPYFKIDTVSKPNQFTRFYDEVIVNAFDIDSYVPDCEDSSIYRGFNFSSQYEFFRMVAHKYGKDETCCSLIEVMLEENEKIFTFNPGYDSIIIFIPYNLVDKERIDYYQLESSRQWGHGEINKITVVISNFAGNVQKVKAYENISRSIISHGKSFDTLIQDICLNNYKKLIKDCLTSE